MQVPPRPDLPASQPVFEQWEPIPPRRAPRIVAALTVVALAVAALAGGLQALEGAMRPPSDAGDHSFLAFRSDGSPARWNPCAPIRYVINPGQAPEGSVQDVHEAVLRVTAETGIAFEYGGATDEIPTMNRAAYQPGNYGDRWAPVLIAWVDPRTSSISFEDEGHAAAAVAKPSTARSERVFVSGWIAMSLADPNPPGFAVPGMQGPVLLHEFGHILGLGHVEQRGEIMEPAGGGMTGFGPGDREGLRRLGHEAGCLETPEPGT